MKKLTIIEMNRLTPEAFKQSGKISLVVVLDNIRSLYNVGSVFRTSDAFRVEKVCICGLTCPPPNPEIHKTALGAEFSVDWTYSKDIHETIRSLKEDGYILLAIEQAHGSLMLNEIELDPSCKYAIIFGNEVKGVQQSVIDCCDGCIEIPQFGTKHSLNVSVATGIVLWHFFQKLASSVKL
ncbi:MAG: RNA methyltransferase [Bacteroidota bacterium]|nr:RNA methyltransferase [Bacteroidota bacterium]